MKLTKFCPAKVNLFLHIVRQKDNGYHELQTLFCLLNWGDSLTLAAQKQATLQPEPIISITGMNHIPLKENLIAKAIYAFLEATQISGYDFEIEIEKKTPMGMGLGGGSSDAASCLLALNELYDHPLSLVTLQEVGVKLGADVPVFIGQKHAWAESIGEVLTPMPLPKLYFLLVFPEVHINTANAFQLPGLKRDNGRLEKTSDWNSYQHNHFEPVIRQAHPNIERCFNLLAPFGTPQLTGTGACVFLCSPDEVTISAAAKKLKTIAPDLRLQETSSLDISNHD